MLACTSSCERFCLLPRVMCCYLRSFRAGATMLRKMILICCRRLDASMYSREAFDLRLAVLPRSIS